MIVAVASLFAIQILGNSLAAYAIALGIFLITFFALHLLVFILKNRLNALARKNKAYADHALLRALHKIHPVEYVGGALYLALQTLALSPLLDRILSIGFLALITYVTIEVVSVLLTSFLQRAASDENHQHTAPMLINLTIIGKGLLWVFGICIVLSNAGVNITSLIAGLGIGGVAVALALQSILSDLFASFAIQFDKPFLVGDTIIVGDKMGVVEKIGIKTTRIRALQGEEIVFANKQLTDAQIQNFKRMRERRVVFSLNITYETPHLDLQEIPTLLRTIIERQQAARFERAHLASLGTTALIFEVVYYVLSDNYRLYMDVQQQINLDILEAFSERQIAIAHFSHTLFAQ